MGQLTLLLAFHNHQPDGNFDHVFAQGYEDCYGPLLKTLADFPRVRVALHHTGALFEWLDKNRPDYLKLLRDLVAQSQIEIMGGGFYEPMLAVLPARDAAGQIAMMNDFVKDKLGTTPVGMWLAERVWEPALAETIGKTGLRYTLTDDTHFRNAGVMGDLSGYYVTEKSGTPLAIFPIEKELRYAIPFRKPDEAMETLYQLADRGERVVATYGDDGEKFGMWPGTKEWVWEKGWLREFFKRLSEAPEERVRTGLLREALDEFPPSGRVYLPTASYHEMGEWALPAETQLKLEHAMHELDANPYWKERLAPFVRGGLWQNFLAKYPEANFMHKKMVLVSDKVAAAEQRGASAELAHAKQELYRAQTNCGYWHGLFGGVYLNYIRHAVYTHLIAAETIADRALGVTGPIARKADLDADMVDEVELSSGELRAYVRSDEGGGVYELDVIAKRMNLLNVMGRRRESYHDKLRHALEHGDGGGGDGGGPKSIHDIVIVKDRSLGELLEYDKNLRLAFTDHFVAADVSCADLARNRYHERGDFARGRYRVVETGVVAGVPTAKLFREGVVDGAKVTLEKTIAVAGRKLSCRYRIRTEAPLACAFASESALTLLAGHDGQRRYRLPAGAEGQLGEVNLASHGELPSGPGIEMVDEWLQLNLRVVVSPAARLCRFPLESASQSEGGFERTYQGSAIVPIWRLDLAPGGEATFEVAIHADDLSP